MSDTVHTVTFTINVDDAKALEAAAIKRAVFEGTDQKDAEEDLVGNIGACLQMMLDPGELCAGATIIDATYDSVNL